MLVGVSRKHIALCASQSEHLKIYEKHSREIIDRVPLEVFSVSFNELEQCDEFEFLSRFDYSRKTCDDEEERKNKPGIAFECVLLRKKFFGGFIGVR